MEQRMVEQKDMKSVVWLVVGRVESLGKLKGGQLAVLRDNSMAIRREPMMVDCGAVKKALREVGSWDESMVDRKAVRKGPGTVVSSD
jgi:hypothetical protein